MRLLPAWLWFVGGALAVAPLFWLPLDFRRPSDFSSWFLYLSVIGPASIVSFLVSNLNPADVLPLPITLVIGFALFEIFRRKRYFRFKSVCGSDIVFKFILPVTMCCLIVAIFSYTGFKLDLSLDDVYMRREAAADMAPARSLIGYGMGWLRGLFVPLAIAIPVLYRRYFSLWVLAVFGVLAAFSFSGEKSDILYPMVILATLFLISRRTVRMHIYIPLAFILITVFALMEILLVNSSIISTILVRRQLIVPSQLTTYYWEFFSSNPLMFMSDGILHSFIGQRYTLSTPMLIGTEFFNWEMHANANMWATGFAHFGYVGVGMVSVIGGTILRFVDSVARNGKHGLAVVVSITIAMTWSNTGLHTSLVTNGVGILLVALYIFPSLEFTKAHPLSQIKGTAVPICQSCLGTTDNP